MNTTRVFTRKNLVHSARDNTDDNHKIIALLSKKITYKAQAHISNKILKLSQPITNRLVFAVLTERIKRSVRSVAAAVAAELPQLHKTMFETAPKNGSL